MGGWRNRANHRKIGYDLDETPVDIKRWWELENTKTYYYFLKEKSVII